MEKKLFFYIICMPFLIGIFLADFLHIDISQVSAQYIGILYGLQKAGVDIRVKSIIFMEYLIAIPIIGLYFYIFPKTNIQAKNIQTENEMKTLYKNKHYIKTYLQKFIGFFWLFIFSLWILSDPRPGKKLVGLIQWNFTFAFMVAIELFIGLISICVLFSLIKDLLFFLQNKLCRFWQKTNKLN